MTKKQECMIKKLQECKKAASVVLKAIIDKKIEAIKEGVIK